jgi:hypothetical protein
MKLNELETEVQQHEKYSSSLSRQDEGQETENVWIKSEFYRTCAELRATDRSIPSGMQWIDPDGLGVGENPIHVYCDMSTGKLNLFFCLSRKKNQKFIFTSHKKDRPQFYMIVNRLSK